MALTFESAVDSLSAIFPSWDKETLGSILISNGGRVESTIEMILSMEGSGENSNNQSNDIHVGEESNVTESHDRVNNEGITQNASRRDGNYRGTKCDLPSDFLRLPSKPAAGPRVLADEELALILQNELFQRELVNQGYAREGDGGNSRFWPDFGIRTQSGAAGTAASSSQAMPDLGIMKSLSSMSETAKKNLSSLALRFSSNETATNGTRQETKPLVGDDNDDDEDEVISFEDTASSGGHFLNENRDNYWTNNPVLESTSRK